MGTATAFLPCYCSLRFSAPGKASDPGIPAEFVPAEPGIRQGASRRSHVLVVAEPAGQPQPVLAGLGALALVVCDALGDRAAVPGTDAGQLRLVETGLPAAAGGGGSGVGVDKQVGHGAGPDLPSGAEAVQPGQVPQPVGAAPGVQSAGEVLISLVAVADDGASVAGQDTAGVDSFFGPVTGVHRGEELSAGHVDIMQVPGDPGGALVGVQHTGCVQQDPDPVHERPEPAGGLAADPGAAPGRDAHAGQRVHQLRSETDGPAVPADRPLRAV